MSSPLLIGARGHVFHKGHTKRITIWCKTQQKLLNKTIAHTIWIQNEFVDISMGTCNGKESQDNFMIY